MNDLRVNETGPKPGMQSDLPKKDFRYKVEKKKEIAQPEVGFSKHLNNLEESEENNVIEIPQTSKDAPIGEVEIPKTEDKSREAKRLYTNSLIKSSKGFFSYCFDDENGLCQEFETLGECRRAARECSRQNPDMEINIYGMSSMYFVNGKER